MVIRWFYLNDTQEHRRELEQPMPRHNRWPTEAELQRIEAIATFARIAEMADSTFDAIEQGDMARAVERLARLKGKAARGSIANAPAGTGSV